MFVWPCDQFCYSKLSKEHSLSDVQSRVDNFTTILKCCKKLLGNYRPITRAETFPFRINEIQATPSTGEKMLVQCRESRKNPDVLRVFRGPPCDVKPASFIVSLFQMPCSAAFLRHSTSSLLGIVVRSPTNAIKFLRGFLLGFLTFVTYPFAHVLRPWLRYPHARTVEPVQTQIATDIEPECEKALKFATRFQHQI